MEDLLPTTVFGLPLHPLMVHAAVVLVPLTALLVLGAAALRRVRVWAGPLPVVMAAGCVALCLLSTESGENLMLALPENQLIEKHADLGDQLIWWALGMLVVAVLCVAVARRTGDTPRGVAVLLLVLGVVVPTGAVVQTVLTGHSGATAVWDGIPTEPRP